jgi:photosystem II stability/assembly factor-like uncharacterized protein
MKISSFNLLLIQFLFFISSILYAQWELRYPDIPSDQINDIEFLNENVGFAVNSGGSILMTTDGGETWKIKAHYQRNTFSEIKFINSETGFAISPHSYIDDDISFVFTTDGGLTWHQSNTYMGDALTFLPVSESSILKSSINEGTISKLDNFFGNWEEVYRIPFFMDTDVSVPYGDIVQFTHLLSGRILALGSSWRAKNSGVISDSLSFILKSDDLGNSWDTLWCDLPYTCQAFSFINDSIGWLGAEGDRIYKTNNGGVKWSLQYEDTLENFPIKSISSPDNSNIFAVDGNGRVIYSANGGLEWEYSQVGQAKDYPFKINFLNSTKGFLAGLDSTSYNFWVTNDGGKNWERVSKSIRGNLRKIDFVSEHIGMGVGDNCIYKTKDGGRIWNVSYSSQLEYFSGLDMLDSLNVWAVSYDSLYKTTDGGKSWSSIRLNDQIRLMRGVQFLDKDVGIIYEVWEKDSVYNYVTTDGGKIWKQYPINNNQFVTSFNKMKFTDPGHLWFANQYGVWVSKDTARTWEFNKIENSFYAFDFLDSLYGWVSLGQFRKMAYTTDGGISWTDVEKPYPFQPEDVFIYGEGSYMGNGIFSLVSGYGGSLVRFQKGESFVSQIPTYTGNPLYSFASFRSGNLLHIWVAGSGMTVLHYEDYVSDVNESKIKKELSYNLSQNYPNPFNPSTIISYSIPKESFVDLKVFDILGREIAELVKEQKAAGKYSVQFDGTNLSSGVYFYSITAGNYHQTKKMILTK